MQLYEFGKENTENVMLIHGMGTTWEMSFSSFIAVAQKEYHIIAVSLDGYNPNETSEFESIAVESKKIADYLIKNYNGNFDTIYGSSMGGAVLLSLLSNTSIRIKSAIIDGLYASNYGIFSKAITKLMTSLTVKTMSGNSTLLMKMMGIENTDDLRNKMYTGASKNTIYNCFYESYIFNLPANIHEILSLKIWYGSKERYPQKLSNKIKKVNKNAIIKIFDAYGHGALLNNPNQLLAEIKNANRGE